MILKSVSIFLKHRFKPPKSASVKPHSERMFGLIEMISEGCVHNWIETMFYRKNTCEMPAEMSKIHVAVILMTI